MNSINHNNLLQSISLTNSVKLHVVHSTVCLNKSVACNKVGASLDGAVLSASTDKPPDLQSDTCAPQV